MSRFIPGKVACKKPSGRRRSDSKRCSSLPDTTTLISFASGRKTRTTRSSPTRWGPRIRNGSGCAPARKTFNSSTGTPVISKELMRADDLGRLSQCRTQLFLRTGFDARDLESGERTRLACGFRRLAETRLSTSILRVSGPRSQKVRDGETPSPARETHALPRTLILVLPQNSQRYFHSAG